MIKRVFTLFKIARSLALSNILDIVFKFHKPPIIIKIIFKILGISFRKKNSDLYNINDEEQLCKSIQNLGTSFIKLGPFLSTRPDIIGEE